MADNKQLYVVTKDGKAVSRPMSESDAQAEAASQRQLLESQGQTSAIAVVPYLLG